MPIRINLLAESQLEEELRRRDPIKRALWVGALVVALVLLWSAYLQFRVFMAHGQLAAIEDQLGVRSKQFDQVTQKEHQLGDINGKLIALQYYSTNRFLWGSVLNALEQSIVNDVQLISFHGEQNYIVTEEVKAKTNENGKIIVFPKPGGTTQKIKMEFDAKDASPTPGDQVGKYKQALSDCSLFQSLLGKTNEITLRNISPPSLDGENGKTVVQFILDCRLPDKLLK